MKTSLYAETFPVFIHYLESLIRILDRAKRFTKNGKSEKELIEGRLAPDMYTFTQQIGYAYFMALEAATNLTGKVPPQFTYDEKSIRELKASIVRVIEFLGSIKPRDIAKSERKKIKTFLDPDTAYARERYVRYLALPNFFFHVTTAYDILRHLGVPLKKDDYLGL